MLELEFYKKRFNNSSSQDLDILFSRWQNNTNAIVERYDHLLHQSLDKIFCKGCPSSNSSSQFKKFRLEPQHDTDWKSIINPILEQEPILSEHFSKEEIGKLSLLWISVLVGYEKSAELLVRSGADVNEFFCLYKFFDPKVIDGKWTVLHLLVRMHPSPEIKQLVRLLVDHGADLQARDKEGETPLHYAVRGGQAEMIKILLEKGADVNVADDKGITPLLVAISTNKANELVPLLIKYGADVFAEDHLGMNALHCLALLKPVKDASTELARVFIEKGVSLDDKSVDRHYQPIHLAAWNENDELLKFYLDHGANVNAKTKEGKSPLHLAAISNEPDVLETLIKRGANVDLKSIRGTALHAVCECAAWSTSVQPDGGDEVESVIIRRLLSAGADVLGENSVGWTPLAIITFDGDVDRQEIKLIIKTLALKKALQPSLELKDQKIIERYQKLHDYYRDCIEEINRMKSTKFIETCSFFELLTKNHRQIAKLMRNPEFETKFDQSDLNGFSNYADDIRRAFKRAQNYYHAMIEQENLINDAVYNILPYLVVKKVVHCILND